MIVSNERIAVHEGTNITSDSYTYSSWYSSNADEVYLKYQVATLNATSVGIQVQGRMNSDNNKSASLLKATITGAKSISDISEITPNIGEARVGVKIDGASVPNNVYISIIKIDKK